MGALEDSAAKLRADRHAADEFTFEVVLEGVKLGDEFYVKRTESGIHIRTTCETDAVHFPIYASDFERRDAWEHNVPELPKLRMTRIRVRKE